MSGSNCCFLTHVQVSQETGKVVWYSHLFKNFPQFVVIHTVKGISMVSEAEVDVFLEISCFFYHPTDVSNLISCSSAFSKFSFVHVVLKPSLENCERYFASVWNECNCVVVWTFLTLPFFGIGMKNWHFPVLWLPCLFNLYVEYIKRNIRLDESQVGIKIARRNINKLRYADDTTLIVDREEELMSFLMRVKNLAWSNIKKTKILAPSSITSWWIEGENVGEQWQIFFSWAPKSWWMVTAAMKLVC